MQQNTLRIEDAVNRLTTTFCCEWKLPRIDLIELALKIYEPAESARDAKNNCSSNFTDCFPQSR